MKMLSKIAKLEPGIVFRKQLLKFTFKKSQIKTDQNFDCTSEYFLDMQFNGRKFNILYS